MGEHTVDNEILSKFLSGQATPEEAMLVDEWLTEPENKKVFKDLVHLWTHAGPTLETYVAPSVEAEWNALQSKIHESRPAVKRLSPYWWAAAAAVLILLAPIAWIFTRMAQPAVTTASTDVQLGSSSKNMRDSLPDGSIVITKKNSKLVYGAGFNRRERLLQLNGEAYFMVKPKTDLPFTIQLDELRITVLGTIFNVRQDTFSRDVEVQVLKGRVQMATPKHQLIINGGQGAVYRFQNREMHLRDSIEVNAFSYATKNFVFNNQSLREVILLLQEAYQFDLKYMSPQIKDCRITATFNDKPLSYILEVIAATLSIRCTLQENTLTVEGNGCK